MGVCGNAVIPGAKELMSKLLTACYDAIICCRRLKKDNDELRENLDEKERIIVELQQTIDSLTTKTSGWNVAESYRKRIYIILTKILQPELYYFI